MSVFNNRGILFCSWVFLLSGLTLGILLLFRPLSWQQAPFAKRTPAIIESTKFHKQYPFTQVSGLPSKPQWPRPELKASGKTRSSRLSNKTQTVSYQLSSLMNTHRAPGGPAGILLPKVHEKLATEDRLLTRLGNRLSEEQAGFSISPGKDFWRALGEGNSEFSKFLKDLDLKRPPLTVEYHLFF